MRTEKLSAAGSSVQSYAGDVPHGAELSLQVTQDLESTGSSCGFLCHLALRVESPIANYCTFKKSMAISYAVIKPERCITAELYGALHCTYS